MARQARSRETVEGLTQPWRRHLAAELCRAGHRTNELMAPVHDHMPVIPRPEDYGAGAAATPASSPVGWNAVPASLELAPERVTVHFTSVEELDLASCSPLTWSSSPHVTRFALRRPRSQKKRVEFQAMRRDLEQLEAARRASQAPNLCSRFSSISKQRKCTP